MNKIEKSLREMWGNLKCTMVYMRVLEEEGRKKAEKVFKEIMADNFSNLLKNTDLHIHPKSPKNFK